MSIQAVLFHPGRRLYTLVTAPADKITRFSTPETFQSLLRAMLMTIPGCPVHVLVVGNDLILNDSWRSGIRVESVGLFFAHVAGYPGYMERLQKEYKESLDTTAAAVSMARFRYHTAAKRATKRIPPYLEIASFFSGVDAVTEFLQALHLPETIDPNPVMEPAVLEETTEMPLGVSLDVNEARKYCGFQVDSRLFGQQPHTYEGMVVVPVMSLRWSEGRKLGQTFPDGPPTRYWEWPAFTGIVRDVMARCQHVSSMKRAFPALPGEPVLLFADFFKHPRVLEKIHVLGLDDVLRQALEVA